MIALQPKIKSIFFFLFSLIWIGWVQLMTEPSTQALRMTGTGGGVVGGGCTPFTSIKDRTQFFANQPIMGAKGSVALSHPTTHGGSSALGGGNITSSSSSSASGLGGGEVGSQYLLINQHGRSVPGQSFVSKPLPRSEKLLSGTHGNAGFIPEEIGKMMEGKTFRDFDHFRKEFWEAVSQSSYASEFGASNTINMQNGLSPFVHKSQQLGSRNLYELHHITPINKGGSVYDLSNITIATPRYHQEILQPQYHYGRK